MSRKTDSASAARDSRRPTPKRHGRTPSHGRGHHAAGEAAQQTLIYGIHAVEAALSNPARGINRLYLTQNAEQRLATAIAGRSLAAVRVLPRELDKRLGPDTVHQGALAECEVLPEVALGDVVSAAQKTGRPIVVLDQVTDPHNVGAVLRSAAAFGSAGLVMTRRHSPPLAGALAKSASGALELVPVVLVQNLARSLAELSEHGVPVIGLAGEGEALLEAQIPDAACAIVLGAEGKGLRQSTREACSGLCRIAGDGPLASLNVSNAAAIALHLHAMARDGRLGKRG